MGYRVKNDCLVIDAAESAIVQELFFRYANQESVTVLIRNLEKRGIRTKHWLTRTGKPRGGQPFNRNAIYVLLKNRVYLGEVFFGGSWQRGAHEPIIEGALWAQVQGLLENRSRRGDTRADTENDTIFMSKGRVFGADGRAMSPWLSSAYKGRKYAYYIPQREIAEGAGASGLPRLQAANLNDQVWSYLRRCLADPAWLLEYLPTELTAHADFDASLVVGRLMTLEGITNLLFPVNQKALVLRLIDEVTVHSDRLEIVLNLDELMELILELLADKPELATTYRQLYSSARSHGR